MNRDASRDRLMAIFDTELTPIDYWLRDRLAERYKPVLREDLPTEWLRLVEESSKD
jgi:hypothetical protein